MKNKDARKQCKVCLLSSRVNLKACFCQVLQRAKRQTLTSLLVASGQCLKSLPQVFPFFATRYWQTLAVEFCLFEE